MVFGHQSLGNVSIRHWLAELAVGLELEVRYFLGPTSATCQVFSIVKYPIHYRGWHGGWASDV